jgi:hypothetical protein
MDVYFSLTSGVALNLKLFQVQQYSVSWRDVDKPVTLVVAARAAVRVFIRVVGTGNDAIILARDVAAALNCRKKNNTTQARFEDDLVFFPDIPSPNIDFSLKKRYFPRNPE